jgi:hypothetical protein
MTLQLIVVYLGVIFEAGKKTTKDRIISDSVLGVGFGRSRNLVRVIRSLRCLQSSPSYPRGTSTAR